MTERATLVAWIVAVGLWIAVLIHVARQRDK
jgi:hypothetical protein